MCNTFYTRLCSLIYYKKYQVDNIRFINNQNELIGMFEGSLIGFHLCTIILA